MTRNPEEDKYLRYFASGTVISRGVEKHLDTLGGESYI
jgi:hypothetical protein